MTIGAGFLCGCILVCSQEAWAVLYASKCKTYVDPYSNVYCCDCVAIDSARSKSGKFVLPVKVVIGAGGKELIHMYYGSGSNDVVNAISSENFLHGVTLDDANERPDLIEIKKEMTSRGDQTKCVRLVFKENVSDEIVLECGTETRWYELKRSIRTGDEVKVRWPDRINGCSACQSRFRFVGEESGGGAIGYALYPSDTGDYYVIFAKFEAEGGVPSAFGVAHYRLNSASERLECIKFCKYGEDNSFDMFVRLDGSDLILHMNFRNYSFKDRICAQSN